MQTRTWPYGTAKRVQVLDVAFCLIRNVRTRVLTCVELEGEREAHILVGDGGDEAVSMDVGYIVFRQGGPTGGYWRYERDGRS